MRKITPILFGVAALATSTPMMAVAVPATAGLAATSAAAASNEQATPIYYRGRRVVRRGVYRGGYYGGYRRGYYAGYGNYGYGGYYGPYAYSYPSYGYSYAYPYRRNYYRW
jgi:hypothetical protein